MEARLSLLVMELKVSLSLPNTGLSLKRLVDWLLMETGLSLLVMDCSLLSPLAPLSVPTIILLLKKMVDWLSLVSKPVL